MRLHHICVSSTGALSSLFKYFTSRFSFVPVARRSGEFLDVVVRSGSAMVHLQEASMNPDRITDVCLEVDDVDKATQRVVDKGGSDLLIQAPCVLQDQHGSVICSVVRSCVGSVRHSFVDTRKYSGPFLPGFEPLLPPAPSAAPPPNDLFSHFDHVTLVCEPGRSGSVAEWYAECLDMDWLLTNPGETPEEGLPIAGDVGIRLRSLIGKAPGFPQQRPPKDILRLVLAESLCAHQQNPHLQSFLCQNHGPGVQHAGLHTSRPIADVVGALQRNGVGFQVPPPAYYDLLKKTRLDKFLESEEEFHKIKELGILVDCEEEESENLLLQIFTRPEVLSAETFFLEVIERRGRAKGFGAGNVTALARSIDLQQKQETRSSGS